ncbi:hypothetical protein GGR51DRAFT_517598 [Nemania sp. FL0031]|nr:hypothetical protein GGR51DRAFT_517598 [Nemania sp. FL0031]
MAFKLYNNSVQISQFIVLIIFSPLGIAVTALRFIALRRAARKPGLEDWLAVAATLFFIFTNLAGLIAISILNGREIPETVVESPLDYKHIRQWDIFGLYSYFAHLLFLKYSILALYYRIFGVSRTYRVWIYFFVGFQAVIVIIPCILLGLECSPFERYFDRSIPGTCRDDGLIIVVGEAPNSAVDFALVILAMFMIRPLNLSSISKWRLRVLFSLGAFVGIIGFIKIAVSYSPSALYAFSMAALWTGVQMFVSLLCCCLPVCKPILPSATFWTQVSTRMTHYFTFGRGSAARATTYSAKASDGSRGRNQPKEARQGWENLDDEGTGALAWPQPAYQMESRALSDSSSPATQSELVGIQVHRQIDVT